MSCSHTVSIAGDRQPHVLDMLRHGQQVDASVDHPVAHDEKGLENQDSDHVKPEDEVVDGTTSSASPVIDEDSKLNVLLNDDLGINYSKEQGGIGLIAGIDLCSRGMLKLYLCWLVAFISTFQAG